MRAAAGVVTPLVVALPAAEAAVEQKQSPKLTLKRPAADNKKPHHLVLQVNMNDPAMMNLALNNATNGRRVSAYWWAT